MTLPPLPRTQKRIEASITTRRIPAFLRKHFPHSNVCFEVKRRGRKVAPHQRAALEKAVRDGYYKKMKDDGTRQDFDGIWMPHPVSIVIWIERNGSLTVEKI